MQKLERLDLTNIAIVSINCVSAIESVKAINYSRREINFKEAILFTDQDIHAEQIHTIKINKLNSISEYSDFMLRLADYVDSDYVLIVQSDGFVLSANNWNPAWLKYDYISAPWPDSPDWIQRQQMKEFMVGNWNRVGNGGFSLRSRKFLELSAKFDSCLGFGEDNFLCLMKYNYMIDNGIKFAPVELAKKFSYENPLSEDGHKWNDSVKLEVGSIFGFHGHQLANSTELIALKG
jgi:hypothetical protein